MFSQYPYEGQQNPAIHWDNNDIVRQATPAAVEVNGNFSYFNDEVMPFAPEERLVVASSICGLSEVGTQRTVGEYVGSDIDAIEAIERTYIKANIADDPKIRSRRRERLVARVHLSHALDADPHSLPMPENWQQPFRDLVLMLASALRAEQLSDLYQLTNVEAHLAMATSRAAESLGLAHLETGGPTLVALGANLLDTKGALALRERIYGPLTHEERSLFQTLPARGGPPLLPTPPTKTPAPRSTSMPRPTPHSAPPAITPNPPAPGVTPTTRAALSDSGPGVTSSWIVRPHEKIPDFRNKTLWLQFEGRSTSGANMNARLGQVSLIGIHHAKIQVGPVETSGQLGGSLTNVERAVYCARALSLSTSDIEAIIGVNVKAQNKSVRFAHNKIQSGFGRAETCTCIYTREPFDVSLPTAFKEPQLFRTLEPPQFDGQEREQELLVEFGPHLISGHTRRDIEYNIITSREAQGYPRKLTSTTVIGRDMDTLRTAFDLSTLGLKMLYLVHMDYQNQLAERAERIEIEGS